LIPAERVAAFVAIVVFALVIVSALLARVPFPVGFRRGILAAVTAFAVVRAAAALRPGRRASGGEGDAPAGDR